MLEDRGFTVVGDAANGDAVVRLARSRGPDVTILDLMLTDVDAVTATEAIIDDDPAARVLVLAPAGRDDDLLDAFLAGASGQLFADNGPDELVAGIRNAATGDATVPSALATPLVERLREKRCSARVQAPRKPPPLTARERDILKLLAQGRENSAIAAELVISPATVKTHVAHLLDKLDLDNRVQAAVFAVRHGIV